MRIQWEDYYDSIDFLIKVGKFRYYDGTFHDITNCEINHWYHIRIQFDCGINGDGTNDWHLWIDGVSQDNGIGYEFQGSPEKMNLIEFESCEFIQDPNYEKWVYIDAIGYSWDSSYNIGDNTQPCISLSFTGQDELSQMWYSLDGGEKKEIDGDVFFEKPDLGEHTIQVFGKLHNGDWCQSDIRNFNIYFAPTLLCIHGYGNSGSIWENHLMEREYFIENYSLENIIPLSYYEKNNEPPEFDGVDYDTPIDEIAERLRDYIINQHNAQTISDTLDIICFSMGGLVARYMIKNLYPELKAEGITIEHVATLGTPHYGCYWANLGWWYNVQVGQMASLSPFLASLNDPDDTPYSVSDSGPFNDIKYSIFRGASWKSLYFGDCVVLLHEALLYDNDVTIYGTGYYLGLDCQFHKAYSTNHDGLYRSSRVLRDVFKEFWYN